jgi:hypothetical protein
MSSKSKAFLTRTRFFSGSVKPDVDFEANELQTSGVANSETRYEVSDVSV